MRGCPRCRRTYRDAIDRRGLGYQIARGARNVGDDGAVLFEQPVEETALADVGAPDDRQREAFVDQLAEGKTRDERATPEADRLDRAAGFLPTRDAMSSSAKSIPASSSAINSSNGSFSGTSAAKPTLRLLRRDAGLIKRGGLDKIADGLRLRQVDAAVEIGAQREFAGLGQPRSGGAGALEGIAQDDRGTVTGNLDDIFGGVGTRSGEDK